jgi:choline dehydrogenase
LDCSDVCALTVTVFKGTAGCVLASRLSENPNIQVLLIESGTRQEVILRIQQTILISIRSSSDVLFSRIPFGLSRLFHTKYDYNLYTTPQSNAGGVPRYWPRG